MAFESLAEKLQAAFKKLTGGGKVSAADAEFPFRYLCENDRVPEGLDGDVTGDAVAELVSCRARFDGERLAADGEVAVAYRISGERVVKMPESVRFGERRSAPAGDVRVYYPAPGETLWDAAKRYAVPISALAEKNDLPAALRADDPGSLGKNKYLLI